MDNNNRGTLTITMTVDIFSFLVSYLANSLRQEKKCSGCRIHKILYLFITVDINIQKFHEISMPEWSQIATISEITVFESCCISEKTLPSGCNLRPIEIIV